MKYHKYFKAQKYKQKLEAKHNATGKYGPVYFITNAPDPRSVRESRQFYERFPDARPEDWEKVKGRNYYRYYSRPEIPYTIHEQQKSRSGNKNTFKKCAKDKLRTACKRNPEEVFDKSTCRKTYDPWHFD